MSINPYRKSNIKKIKSKYFKKGAPERDKLASEAGSSGFSKRKFDEILRDEGDYKSERRNRIMKLESENIPKKEKQSGD